ncbi:MAG: glycerol-3-phosphate dehydrogenase/oxidase [Spirochaetota bacterium]
MKRQSLHNIQDGLFDVLVIGGGITGANVLWDATLRGMRSILLEKNDYASGTSQATSKFIHGGLRYLKNMELSLVRESLRERRTLAKITPHAVRPLEFLIPVYSLSEKLLLRLGMFLYDKLSFDKNHSISSDVMLPPYRFYNREETFHKAPQVRREGLLGSFVYFDYTNTNPERHTTEFIFSAKNRGAQAFNYVEVKSVKANSEFYLVQFQDRLSGEELQVKTKVVINASGPWADFTDSLAGVTTEKKLLRSKGIHVVTRKICREQCDVIKKKDGSHLFVIPWRNKTIIGTTDTKFATHPDELHVTREEILDLIEEVNHSYGFADLTLNDVDFYYAGLRPLVEDSKHLGDTYNASRKSEVMDYGDKGFPGYFSALGGKYTTSRAVAQSVVDKVAAYLKESYPACTSEKTPLDAGNYADLKTLVKDMQRKYPTVDGEKVETLCSRYGNTTGAILQEKQGGVCVLANGEKLYGEEIAFIAKNEDVHFASDFYFRRSGAGVPGLPLQEEQDKILQILQATLAWDDAKVKQDAVEIEKRYRF